MHIIACIWKAHQVTAHGVFIFIFMSWALIFYAEKVKDDSLLFVYLFQSHGQLFNKGLLCNLYGASGVTGI